MIDFSKNFSTIREVIEYSTDYYKDKIAYQVKLGEDKYNNITFEQVKKDVVALAESFIQMGYKGKRIGVIGLNSYEWILTYYATVFIGSIIVPLDRALMEEEIVSLVSRSEISALVYSKDCESKVQKLSDIRLVPISDEGENSFYHILNNGKMLVENGSCEYEKIDINPDELSVLIFTSGTTSASKAVMLSQRNIASNTTDLTFAEDFSAVDVNLALLPLHHTFGMGATLLFLRLGVKTVFCEGLKVAKALNEYKVSVLVGVPLIVESMYRQIIRTAKKQGMYKKLQFGMKLSSFLMKFKIDIRRKLFASIHSQLGGNLNLIIVGAAALHPDLTRFFNGIGITTVQGYGLSETSPVVSAEKVGFMSPGSVGIAMKSVDIKIDNPDENGIGEILVKGPNVMLGYYNEPVLTDEVFKDGYFCTGDLGRIDKKGLLYITGRKKDVIVLQNGKNVFPEELEQLVNMAPYVMESLVFHEEDDSLSVNVVYDKSQFDNGDNIYELIENDIDKINSRLVSYKKLKKLYITDEPMIKTTTAKIKRKENVEKIKAR
jgi:long-chain acyl-CoA synthetase